LRVYYRITRLRVVDIALFGTHLSELRMPTGFNSPMDYLLFRLRLTRRPTRASHVRTFNSGRSPRGMTGRLDTGLEPFFPAFGSTTLRLGSVSQVSTGIVCVLTLIMHAMQTHCLFTTEHGRCHNTTSASCLRNQF
jgi:hypothetical protein